MLFILDWKIWEILEDLLNFQRDHLQIELE